MDRKRLQNRGGATTCVLVSFIAAGLALTQPAVGAVRAEQPASSFQILYGISALSTKDVWAAGYEQVANSARTLVEHWDGTSWTRIPTPNPGRHPQGYAILRGIHALAADDVWTVGEYEGKDSGFKTLVEHWDGEHWTVVPSPNPGTGYNGVLQAVSAAGGDDVWAVGQFSAGRSYPALILHWDGDAWTRVRAAQVPGTDNVVLASITPTVNGDMWAVGEAQVGAGGGRLASVVEHWDGSRWSVFADARHARNQVLAGVSATSGHDAWAVGSAGRTSLKHTLIEHWDGSTWTRVPSPNLPGPPNGLEAVSAVSATDAWAVGYHGYSEGVPLMEHWDGTEWSIVKGPDVHRSDVLGVTAIGARDAWAVGAYESTGVRALRAHWDGSSWSLT